MLNTSHRPDIARRQHLRKARSRQAFSGAVVNTTAYAEDARPCGGTLTQGHLKEQPGLVPLIMLAARTGRNTQVTGNASSTPEFRR